MEPRTTSISISAVIVNYKVPDSLRQTLRSLRAAALYERTEVIVVDNASGDGSQEVLTAEFPEITWIQLKANIGFGKACNVGARNARGDYLLMLNPDTLVATGTLSGAHAFMEEHPEAGMLGPKILNPDGSLQRACRRGFPTPSTAFYHFVGLSRIFPRSKRFGHYNLTWIDPDRACPVDAISGSFMFIRRPLFETLGGFDEQFFMYGEDLDLCWRVREKGWQVWYLPQIQIVHFKNRVASLRPFKARIAFYEAMVIYSRKHRPEHGMFFPGWLIFFGICVQAAAGIGSRLVRDGIACLIDLGVINAVLALCLTARFAGQGKGPYDVHGALAMLGMHGLLSASFIAVFVYFGIYSRKKYSTSNLLLAGFFASVIFMAFVYFVQSFAFSRIAFGAATVIIVLILAGLRLLLPRLLRGLKRILYARDRVIVIGNGTVPSRVIQNIELERSAVIAGLLWTGETPVPGSFEGYPVLGRMEQVAEVLERTEVDMVLIATGLPWYSYIIEALAKVKARNLTIRWVPRELFDRRPDELPAVIPLCDFSV